MSRAPNIPESGDNSAAQRLLESGRDLARQGKHMDACSKFEDGLRSEFEDRASRSQGEKIKRELRCGRSASYVQIVQSSKRDAGKRVPDCDFAFRRLVDLYWRHVFRICIRILGSQDVEDVMQDVFVKIWDSIADCEPERFPGWVGRIAANVCNDHHRKMTRSITNSASLELTAELPARGINCVDASDQRDFFECGVKPALPAEDYELVWLRYYMGWQFSEIAESTGETDGQIANRHRRIREDLKIHLTAQKLVSSEA